MSKLFGSHPLLVDKYLAKKIGLNEAMVLQQIHYWLEINKEKNINFHEDKHWTYNTMAEWAEEFPFWSLETVKRTFKRLREKNLITTGNFNKMKIDRTLWYTINYEELEKLIDYKREDANSSNSKGQNKQMENNKTVQAIPEISTEINQRDNNLSISQSNNKEKYKGNKKMTEDRFDYDLFDTRYKKILDKVCITFIDESYREAVIKAVRLLVLDGINNKKIKIGENYIPANLFNSDIEKIDQIIVEHGISKLKKISRYTKIKNTIGYLKACIYNAISEMKVEVDSSLRYHGVIF